MNGVEFVFLIFILQNIIISLVTDRIIMNILVVTEKHKIASEIANILHESKIVKHQTA